LWRCQSRRGERAEALGGTRGPYALQAAIAACHARARTPAETNWARIAALYEALTQVAPSPVVELNRAAGLGRLLGELGVALPVALALDAASLWERGAAP